MSNGYPTADDAFATAAGLANNQDWVRQSGQVAASTGIIGTAAGEIVFVPASLTGNAKGLTCYVKYTEAASATTPPVIAVSTNGCRSPAPALPARASTRGPFHV